MDTLTLLTTRRSNKQLSAPGPDAGQLETILQAATQVPDHGNLTPWRFVVIQSEDGLQRFRRLLTDTVTELNFGEDSMRKAEQVGHMAPLVIAVIAKPNFDVPKPKPVWEQFLSAGCAAYAAQLAAKAQGFDNVWITGLWTNSPLLRAACECGDKDKIIGLLMIGTAAEPAAKAKNTDLDKFVRYW